MPKLLYMSLALGLISCQHSPSSTTQSAPGELWAGNTHVHADRSPEKACGQGENTFPQEFVFSSWHWQRASVVNVCFEVWKPNVTDNGNPDFWKILDVKAHYKRDGIDADFQSEPVNAIGQSGNNKVYAWDLRSKNPIQTDGDASRYGQAVKMELYFTINDFVLKPSDASAFHVVYKPRG